MTNFFELLQVALIAMLPVLELRGAIPFGMAKGLEPFWVVLFAIIGNMLPVPFLILFTRRVFEWIKVKIPKMGNFILRLENRAHGKSHLVQKYGFWGICLLVAIPLPGTGAWTGALVAAVLDMRLKNAVPAITIGVIIAAAIVSVPSIGILA